jgi:hypothetical protein
MPYQLCAICGIEKATTMDHIPPKGIFAKPRPQNLITVPACKKCNNAASKDDEDFRAHLSLHVGKNTPETQALWNKGTLNSLKHNRRLLNNITSKMKKVSIRTKEGIIYDEKYAILWSDTHDKTIERMIRGLYYHHFGEILGNRVIVKVQWRRSLTEKDIAITKGYKQYNIGGNSLIYRFARDKESSLISLWLFQFYGRHWASGYTIPVALPDKVPQSTTLTSNL